METTEIHKVKEVYIDKDEGCCFGENDFSLDDSTINTLSDLYRYGVCEFGRCTSKVFIDGKDNNTQHIGYIFEKRLEYNDNKETYLQETWLTIEHYRKTTTIESLPVN